MKKSYTLPVILVLFVFIFIQTCGVKNKISQVNKKLTDLQSHIDSVTNIMRIEAINEGEMETLIKETPAWKTLRIEEISDKEKISINALEQKK